MTAYTKDNSCSEVYSKLMASAQPIVNRHKFQLIGSPCFYSLNTFCDKLYKTLPKELIQVELESLYIVNRPPTN